MQSIWLVAIYDESRQYGGPEEGGWYYNTGELLGVDSAWTNEDVAWEKARNWNEAEHTEYDAVTNEGWHRDRHDWRYAYSGPRATVVELGRRELPDEIQDQLCHSDGDYTDEDMVTKWYVPEHFPTGRPHYC